MKTSLLALIFASILSACASMGEPVKMAENDRTTLTCSGIKTWNDCKNQAHETCPNGFNIASELENILIQRREVEISCKA